MRETRGQCAQNGRTGLKQAPKRAAQAVKGALHRLKTDAHDDAAALMNTFSTACYSDICIANLLDYFELERERLTPDAIEVHE